jgi:hypothetical protein
MTARSSKSPAKVVPDPPVTRFVAQPAHDLERPDNFAGLVGMVLADLGRVEGLARRETIDVMTDDALGAIVLDNVGLDLVARWSGLASAVVALDHALLPGALSRISIHPRRR